ncbi:hypothetical protein GGR51DRAFT_566618 [Nemania sp. FL0031]|nr:hypothetical protein GGR51DRAFT_566618 [Nemania sp. FL0031]
MNWPKGVFGADSAVDDVEAVSLVENHDTYEKPVSKRKRHTAFPSYGYVYLTILHIIILILAGMLLKEGFFYRSDSPSQTGRSWSPVQDFVKYKVNTKHPTDHGYYSVYSGTPSEEQDGAWDRLITPVYFNISREELTRAGESFEHIIELTDGGYIASLGVYHELHCIRNLRLYVFRDRYYPNLTESQHRYLKGHLGSDHPLLSLHHCLEVLRVSTMCHANTVINSYKWDTETIDKPLTKSNSRSVCVDWNSIEDWSFSRKVSYVPPVKWPSQNQAPEEA